MTLKEATELMQSIENCSTLVCAEIDKLNHQYEINDASHIKSGIAYWEEVNDHLLSVLTKFYSR